MDKPDIETIYSADEIKQRITELAAEIAQAKFEDLVVVPILKGSFIFAADLIRGLYEAGVSPEIDFLSLASYRGTESTGKVEILRDISAVVENRDILLIDDILESGHTLAFAKDLIAARGANRVCTCVLLEKPARRVVDVEADFLAYHCPDVFVVGYGMDLDHRFRELPFVGRIVQ
ncbi:MAG: hypoxanthine phosphoribosyltransferase [Methyloligellaceae bacterium]